MGRSQVAHQPCMSLQSAPCTCTAQQHGGAGFGSGLEGAGCGPSRHRILGGRKGGHLASSRCRPSSPGKTCHFLGPVGLHVPFYLPFLYPALTVLLGSVCMCETASVCPPWWASGLLSFRGGPAQIHMLSQIAPARGWNVHARPPHDHVPAFLLHRHCCSQVLYAQILNGSVVTVT